MLNQNRFCYLGDSFYYSVFVKAESSITDNCLQCGGEQRNLANGGWGGGGGGGGEEGALKKSCRTIGGGGGIEEILSYNREPSCFVEVLKAGVAFVRFSVLLGANLDIFLLLLKLT